jgi:hypothetical protein
VTSPRRPSRLAWPLTRVGVWLLTLLAAVGLLVFGAGTASAASLPDAGSRVRVSTPETITAVGVSEHIAAGQGRGPRLPQPQLVVATGVAAETEPEWMAPRDLNPTHGISGDSSTKGVRGLRNSMKDGSFDWNKSPISIVRNEGQSYVVDGHHRLAAAKLAGLDQVAVRDVTGELLNGGFKGYSDMADVLDGVASFMGNRLNPHKLR